MYFETPVKIPKVDGKITFKTKGSSRYVLLELERTYIPERKYNVVKRKIIGKLVDGKEGWMYPNETFMEFFPSSPIPPAKEEAAPVRSAALGIGSFLVISSVIKHYGLRDLLKPHFGDDTGLLLDLAAYLIVCEDNAGQYYPDYAYRHALFTKGMRPLSDATVSRFFQQMTRDQQYGFLNDWNAVQDHQRRVYLSYDSTNKNCQAGDVEIAEFGKAKIDIDAPIFNYALLFDQNNQLPLLYEEYPGSINDICQLKYLVDKVQAYDYKSVGFVLDRGYFSRANILYMDAHGHPFIMMVKGCKALVSSFVLSRQGTFEHRRDCFVEGYRIYGTTVKSKLFDLNDPKEKERHFHVFFNPTKMAKERDKLEQELEDCKRKLEKLEGKVTDLPDVYRKYFKCHFEKIDESRRRFLYATELKDVIERDLKLCGYFCIVSSDEMTAEEAYRLYSSRDASEKLFRADKTFLGSSSMRVHSTESVRAKLFVEFIALIIRSRIYSLLKEELVRTRSRNKHLTVPGALKELDKLELVRRTNGRYFLDHALTKTQKIILSAFGISEDTAVKQCAVISDLLAKGENENFDELEIEVDEDNDKREEEDAETQEP